jgi:hypothetical protein
MIDYRRLVRRGDGLSSVTLALLAVVLVGAGFAASGQTTNLHDPFADGGRTDGADPLDTAWFLSTTGGSHSLSVSGGQLVWNPGNANAHFLGHFVHPAGTAGAQSMADGDTLTLSFDFTLAGVTNGNNAANRLRVGLYDSGGAGSRVGADNQGVNHAVFTDDNGYLATFGVNNDGLALHQKLAGTNGIVQALGGAFSELLAAGNGASGALATGVTYTCTFTITNLPGGRAWGSPSAAATCTATSWPWWTPAGARRRRRTIRCGSARWIPPSCSARSRLTTCA